MIKKKINCFFKNGTFFGLTLLFATACSSKLAEDHPQGLWLGKLEVEQGTCPTDRMAALRIDKKVVLFSPDNGALILRGDFDKKERPRHFVATLHKFDMEHKPYDLVFEGKAQNENIIGTYGTPDCRAHITFYRPNHYGLSDAVAH
ncbi:hypothetical protein [Commensalibacter oyaizuii]|uniref:Lipoprotein n=1 Tax=Commensalibacter oyaizuii TaxID=3043873 RepID=A0ABT6Q2E4_9PROT|nr:hypothetical protein [Commensalibacter sp. TBRC 16381]MDI2090731.1 hypothetical protein [Commensalibacter sp. TBRC 16381]